MTNEEAREQIENLREHCSDMARSAFTGGEVLWAKDVEALDQAIKALAQEPCGDAISRQTALKELKESAEHHANDSREEALLRRDRDIIRALPPVNPQHTEAEIQKIQEIEQAEIQKAYELGKAEQSKMGHWIRVADKTEHLVWECSCGWQQRFYTNFCPSCGCRMSEGSE